MAAMACQICFEESAPIAGNTAIEGALCRRSCPARVCVRCLVRHIEVTLLRSFLGVLPVILCPVCVDPMRLERWLQPLQNAKRKYTQESRLRSEYETLSNQACSLTSPCRGNVDYTHLPPFLGYDTRIKPPPMFKDFHALLTRFCGHRTDAQDVITFAFDSFGEANMHELIERTMERIADSERRARLMLEFLHMFPKTHTRCHRAEICFKCKRAGHQGACQDLNLAVVDPNKFIVRCRNCRLFVTKEGGCDHVICVCGFRMLWNNEVAQQEERRARGRPVLPNQRQRKRVLLDIKRQMRRLLVQQVSRRR